MSKPVKSQWDFGELFPTEAVRKVLTVSELTLQVKRLLEKQVGQVWVTGEVTNFRAQSSGHLYFTLKDADSQLSCVLFRNDARDSRAFVQEGRKLIVQGDLTVYEPRGQYQLRVLAVELQGVGALQIAFEKLKLKLNAEGLFAPERKRPLPRYPQRIGIVTSPTGAAIRDVLHVVRRRHAGLEMVLAPCRVQGTGAAEEIAAAIRLLNKFSRGGDSGQDRSAPPLTPSLSPSDGERVAEGRVRGNKRSPQSDFLDLILVTRGGGSLEDLWAFNEEVVARAIFESRLPVVSAVGHEIDFTISDFVADLRAATPSAAAEIITEGVYSAGEFVAAAADRIAQLCRRQLGEMNEDVARLAQRMALMHPRRRFDEWLQELDDLQAGLARRLKQGIRDRQTALRNLRQRLSRVRPLQVVAQRRELLGLEDMRLREQARRQLRELQNRVATLDTRLRLLGPEQVLSRGYSITMDARSGEVIRASADVKPGQNLRTRLKAGEIESKVEGT